MAGAGGSPLADVLDGTLDCVHCGMCLPTCPTYRETGREGSSPRGRIHLMRAVAEGRLPLGPVLAEEAYLCLGCRACETACPSGVGFGALLERTRAEVDRAGLRRGPVRFLERRALRDVLPHRRRLRGLVELLALVQRLRVDRALAALLPSRLRAPLLLLPPIPSRVERRALPRIVPAEGQRRGRVAFFVGCVMPELFGPVNHATVRVLARNGFEVVVPTAQGCCGALQAHAGDEETAHSLLRRNVDACSGLEVDALVTNSAGCGAALREAGRTVPEAVESARRSYELESIPLALAVLARAQAVAGQEEEALESLRELESIAEAWYVCPYELALGYTELANYERAIYFFDKAIDAVNGTVRWQTVDTKYKGVFRNSAGNIDDDWARAHV